MNGASKILTVSYGTFSCTLEGFDEPFSAMKAIAEYFRDLAADDRYFGAEPPIPDAAMLHRIAERAANRSVEARLEDKTVILRTGDALQAQPTPPLSPSPATSAPRASQAAPEAAPRPAATSLLAEESVAAKLQRIRAAMARSARPPVDASFVDEDDLAPIFAASVAVSARTQDSGTSELMLPSPDDWGGTTGETGPADIADMPDQAALSEEITQGQDDLLTPPAAVESVALPEAVAETSHIADFDDLTETMEVAETAETSADVVVPMDPPDELPEAAPEVSTDVLPNSSEPDDDGVTAWKGHASSEPLESVAEVVAAGTAYVPIADNDEGVLVDDFDHEPSDVWDATSFPAAEKDAYEAFRDVAMLTEADDAWPVDPDLPEPDDATTESATASEKLLRARERVLVARASEASADAEEGASTAPNTAVAAPADGEGETDAPQKAERRAILEDNATATEDVTRLLRQANSEMDEPENRRRLSTMAHLKAAVAATAADLRSAVGANRSGETTRLDHYRADLARVVRPRRLDGSTPTERPAPLVLVSEQRIDRPAPDGAVHRVVPRRVSSTNLAVEETPDDGDAPSLAENIFAASQNFSEFAEHLGASDMPDLIEAAAAYTACIEGRPHFTRPHLMRHVAAATEQTDITREDSMRSFGTLLRQGKIAKVKRGQFAITDSSYFLAEARRMTR